MGISFVGWSSAGTSFSYSLVLSCCRLTAETNGFTRMISFFLLNLADEFDPIPEKKVEDVTTCFKNMKY